MTVTDDDLDRLLRDAGDELRALAQAWSPDERTPGHRNGGRAWLSVAATGLAAAAVAGLLVMNRSDDRDIPAAADRTVASAEPVDDGAALDVVGGPTPPPTELPVIGPDSLPFEVLATPAPGYQATYYFSAEITGSYTIDDGHAVLVGWGLADVLVPVIVRPLTRLDTPEPDARSVNSAVVTGWIDGNELSANAQFDFGAGNAVEVEVLGAVPDDAIVALAESLDPSSSELAWERTLPDGFTQIGRQRPAAWERSVTYADLEDDDFMNYAAYSSFPVSMLALDPGSTMTAVDGFPGAWTIEDAGMGGGIDSGRRTYWAGDDGVVRSYVAWGQDAPDDVTGTQLGALVAQIRPATAAELSQYGSGAG